MEDFMTYIGGSTPLDQTFDFLSAPEAAAATDDIAEGLDTWMSPEDRNIVEYYKKYIKGGHH